MDFYTPAPGAERWEIEGEIDFVNTMVMSLDQRDSYYGEYKAYYERTLSDLYIRLARCEPTPSGPSTGQSSASASVAGMAPRKRSLEFDVPKWKTGSPMSFDSLLNDALPTDVRRGESTHVQSGPLLGGDYIDLTALGNERDAFSSINNNYSSNTDPFPELANAYQPGPAPTPAQAFNQEWMSHEDLAQFMLAPTLPGQGYGYGASATNRAPIPLMAPISQAVGAHPQANSHRLERELFEHSPTPGAAAEPEAVQDLIANIRQHEDLQPELRAKTPDAMSSTLMEHQKIALTWLLKMERGKSKGAILADEMGLGKTVQALALMLANPSRDPACKTTLIVAPVALMRQWQKEIERHVKPGHHLSVHVYHGSGKNVTFDKLRKFDVVLTTFGTLSSDFKQKEARREAEALQREEQDSSYKRTARETLALLGRECMWYRVILDEAQCIKNRNTLVSKAANDLMAHHRLCMTGTPMMNSIEELFPLVRFLKIPPYHEWGRFSDNINKPFKSTGHDTIRERAIQRVQALLRSIMLRRGKTTLIDGKQICDIPPKQINLQSVEFSDDELKLYKAIETNSQLQFNRYLKKGTVNNNYASILVMLLRLRQVCCHPHLIKDLGVQASTEGISEVDLKARATQLSTDVVKRLKETDGFECPICYEVEVNPTIFIPCGHTCCGECFQKLIDPSRAIREGNENGSAKCPHCRGVLSSEKITDFQHFCKVFWPAKLRELRQSYDEGVQPASDSEDDDGTEDDDDDEDSDTGSLGDFVVPDDEEESEEESDPAELTDDPADRIKPEASHNEAKLAKIKAKGKRKAKAKARGKLPVTLAQLKKESLRNNAAKRKYLKRLRKQWASSAKVDKTVELLTDIQRNDPTEKTLVFSQFTSLLDLLEVPLSEKTFKYQRYDGSMRMNDRAEAVNQFMDNDEENVMLISLKAGNAGLNLNKASQVIVLDPFWNPFIEDQAVDRAHRMPQKRVVHVHRLLVPETVEDRICALQDQKRDIINTALDERAGKSLTKLGIRELQYLFGLRDNA